MCLLKYFYFVFADFIVVVEFVRGSHDIHNFIDIVRFDNEVAVEYHFFRVSSLMVIFTSNARSKAKAMVSMFPRRNTGDRLSTRLYFLPLWSLMWFFVLFVVLCYLIRF